mmetsp:Transcript_90646/g.256782  ORF Transcript_90646/g.256782 Transcript_90646/m.256782 type:complete len:300 (+) Transcript_90646:523-1422(+)
MAARDQTSCAQECFVRFHRSFAKASPCPASTAPCTMSLESGKSDALLTTYSCTTHSRQTCHFCRLVRPSIDGHPGTCVSVWPRQMLSTQSMKNGLGQVPVVRLIQNGSSQSSPSPQASARISATIRSIASASAASSSGSPATPSNLNMLTRAVRRKSRTADLKRSAYLGPARDSPLSLVSNPFLRPKRTRLSFAAPYPPHGDSHTLRPAPICFAFSATSLKPFGNFVLLKPHRVSGLSQPSSQRKESSLMPRSVSALKPSTRSRAPCSSMMSSFRRSYTSGWPLKKPSSCQEVKSYQLL